MDITGLKKEEIEKLLIEFKEYIKDYKFIIAKRDKNDATIYKWLRTFCWRFFSQQFKGSCLPDGPKVGSVSVSPRGDLRMPSDAVADIWVQQLDNIEV